MRSASSPMTISRDSSPFWPAIPACTKSSLCPATTISGPLPVVIMSVEPYVKSSDVIRLAISVVLSSLASKIAIPLSPNTKSVSGLSSLVSCAITKSAPEPPTTMSSPPSV